MTLPSAGACCASLAFVALVAYAHLVRRDLDGVAMPLSAYFSRPTRGAMFAAYLCLGIALGCTALNILPERSGAIFEGVGAASGALLFVAAASLLPIALTSSERLDADVRSERTRQLHRVCSQIAMIAAVLAMLAYSMLGMSTASRGERALRTDAIIVAVFAALAFAIFRSLPPGSPYYGTWQKMLVALIVIWTLLVAFA
jgi:hypothetical protein